jgi:hypothetical protein
LDLNLEVKEDPQGEVCTNVLSVRSKQCLPRFRCHRPPPQRDEENDTGLLAHLLGPSILDRLEMEQGLAGGVLKNFVLMELRKQPTWSETQPRFFY